MSDEKPKKTIDERLEAIAMHLELAASMQQDHERRMEKLEAETEKRHAEMMEMMTRMGNVILRHEDRLDALDGGDK